MADEEFKSTPPPNNNNVINQYNDSESLNEVLAQFRTLYQQVILQTPPPRDVIYQCGIGLSESELEEDIQLASEIFQDLIDQGYMVTECKFQLAKLYAIQGYIVKARVLLNQVLNDDPNNQQVLEYKQQFDSHVRNEGKLAIYGLIGLGALIALFFAWRRTKYNNNDNNINTITNSANKNSTTKTLR